eukprot:3904529-Rhodomonas_salina.1
MLFAATRAVFATSSDPDDAVQRVACDRCRHQNCSTDAAAESVRALSLQFERHVLLHVQVRMMMGAGWCGDVCFPAVFLLFVSATAVRAICHDGSHDMLTHDDTISGSSFASGIVMATTGGHVPVDHDVRHIMLT